MLLTGTQTMRLYCWRERFSLLVDYTERITLLVNEHAKHPHDKCTVALFTGGYSVKTYSIRSRCALLYSEVVSLYQALVCHCIKVHTKFAWRCDGAIPWYCFAVSLSCVRHVCHCISQSCFTVSFRYIIHLCLAVSNTLGLPEVSTWGLH